MITKSAGFQIGKSGLTPGVLSSLNLALKTHTQIRISVLKSATRDRKDIEKMALEIVENVKFKASYRIIGFTIIIKRLSSKMMEKQGL